jgi:hypothetical protein
MITFEEYVNRVLTADEEDSEPTCPFFGNNGECYVDRRAPGEGCIDCKWAKQAYDSLSPEEIKKLYSKEIQEMADRIMAERKEKRKGARVFCVRCGALGKRTPLRKWKKDLYLCENCFKIMNAVQEEKLNEN